MIGLIKGVDYLINGNYESALPLLSDLSKDGDASAKFYLGSFYILGLGVIQNEQEGERLRSTAIKIFKDDPNRQ